MRSWKQYLDHLRISVFSNQGYVKNDPRKTATDWIESQMKEKFPGDYRVVEFFNVGKGRFDFRIQFLNKHEELMWKLKWS